MTMYFALLLSGLLLIALEIFLPGGIAGTVGLLLMIGSALIVLDNGGMFGAFLAVCTLILGAALFAVVIRVLPNSRFGKKLIISSDMSESRIENSDVEDLTGAEGIALTVLRPAGFAEINGRRVDVVTAGDIIEEGSKVRVILVEGTRVVVKQI